jgi:hypothetical protein
MGMNTSNEINELVAALAAAQGQMTGAVKDAKNPHFRNDYSTLESVIDAIRGQLSSNGIAFIQGLGQYIDGCLQVTTRLAHGSQWIESTMFVPVAGKQITPQVLMSASTYARRYALMAMVGIAPIDSDDDGNAASRPSQAADATPVPLTDNQVATLKALLGELPGEVTVNFLRALNAKNVESVPAARYDWACTALRKKIAEAGAAA